MVASVNTVYQLVMRRAAKEENGFITPADFNMFARNAQQKEFQRILSNYRLFLANKQRFLTYWKGNYDSLEAILDDLLPLRRNNRTLSLSGGSAFLYPNDYAYLISLSRNDNDVTLVDISDSSYYINSFDAAPTESDPVGIRDYNTIKMLPETITDRVVMSYFKIPQGTATNGTPSTSFPTWGYTTVGGKSVYNASTSTDFELPKHLEYRLATQILQDVGIEIREAELFQMAQAEDNKERQDLNG